MENPYQEDDNEDRYNELIAELEEMTVIEVEELDNAIAESIYPAWEAVGVECDEEKQTYAHIKWPKFLKYWNASKEEIYFLERAIDWWADKIIEQEEEEKENGPY